MTFLNAIYSAEELSSTNWSRIHLFYTLFTVVAHCVFGINGPETKESPKLTKSNVKKFRIALDDLSSKYDLYTEKSVSDEEIPRSFRQFIEYSRRGTTDTTARVYRTDFVCSQLLFALAK